MDAAAAPIQRQIVQVDGVHDTARLAIRTSLNPELKGCCLALAVFFFFSGFLVGDWTESLICYSHTGAAGATSFVGSSNWVLDWVDEPRVGCVPVLTNS